MTGRELATAALRFCALEKQEKREFLRSFKEEEEDEEEKNKNNGHFHFWCTYVDTEPVYRKRRKPVALERNSSRQTPVVVLG